MRPASSPGAHRWARTVARPHMPGCGWRHKPGQSRPARTVVGEPNAATAGNHPDLSTTATSCSPDPGAVSDDSRRPPGQFVGIGRGPPHWASLTEPLAGERVLADEILRACQQPAHPTASRKLVRRRGGELAGASSYAIQCRALSWRSPSTQPRQGPGRWSPNAVSRITTAAGGWTRRFAPTAADRWLSECAPSTTRFLDRHACNIVAGLRGGHRAGTGWRWRTTGLDRGSAGDPAEESGGGKALMLQAGRSMIVAGGRGWSIPGRLIAGARSPPCPRSPCAIGVRESHRHVAPHLGVNAADAVTAGAGRYWGTSTAIGARQMVTALDRRRQAVKSSPGRRGCSMRCVQSPDCCASCRPECSPVCRRAGRRARIRNRRGAPAYASLNPTRGWLTCAGRRWRWARAVAASLRQSRRWVAPTWATTQAAAWIHPVIGLTPAATVHQRAFTVASCWCHRAGG